MRSEIILVDPEVLRGAAPAGHGRWVARRIDWLGGEMARLAVVDAIAASVSAELRRGMMAGAGLIVVIGGRGPGADGVTLSGIARALGLELSFDEQARQQVVAGLERQGDDGPTAQDAAVMARLPQGATALPNPIGLPPGIWIEQGETAVVSLPAADYVEMAAVFEAGVMERIRERLGGGPLFEVSVPAGGRELAELYPMADEVMAEVPGTYVRPVSAAIGPESRITLQVAANDPDAEASRRLVEAAVRGVKSRLQG